MNQQEKSQLDRMIRDGGVEDVTQCIRDRKHSSVLRAELDRIEELLKLEFGPEDVCADPKVFAVRCELAAPFMFRNYTDIFNRARKGNLDFEIMGKFVDVLHRIEEGELGQHEGAHEIGKLLKKLYIDSAIKQGDKLDEANQEETTDKPKDPIHISYAQFKSGMSE